MELVRNERLVSSAKWLTLQNFIAQCKSIIHNKNRRAPRADPCSSMFWSDLARKYCLNPFYK